MLFKIVLTPKAGSESPESTRVARTLSSSNISADGVSHRRMFLIDGIERADADRVASQLLVDPVLETAAVFEGTEVEPDDANLLQIMRRTGVMDPIEQALTRALIDSGVNPTAVKSADQYCFAAPVSTELAKQVTEALANEAVDEGRAGSLKMTELPHGTPYEYKRIDVLVREADDDALLAINLEHGLALNIEEMRAIKEYYTNTGQNPTDVEIQTIAQTWSEHCKHKTLAGHVAYSESDGVKDSLFDLPDMPKDGRIDNVLKDTIKLATDELDRDWCLSVFVDNAGVIGFDETDALCFKVETHNHPSAIEPYGGAGTGIGGVIRDILGTGLGARPIMNTNVFCFGMPNVADSDVPKGATHPRKIMAGVVSGVRDYGNRMGIPTPNGGVHFDERYTGNPVVYAGSVGIMPRSTIEKKVHAGDHIVVVGGRTGRDGIGGATFSSLELTSESEVVSSGAVQIGNAIQEQMVMETMLKARDLGLYTAVTDCGAGGLSSAVGEMGEQLGANVKLETVPVKYQGLTYFEIWLSEAQERMVYSVPPANVDELLALFAAEDVEATDIGIFTGDGRLKLSWKGEQVCDVEMSFLHDGMPKIWREAVYEGVPERKLPAGIVEANDHAAVLKAILSSYNVASKEWVLRQYDHEVQAGSAVKPLTGPRRDGPSDACAIVPKLDSDDAVVVSNGLNTRYGDVDPYWMALSNIDEALRNYVATGGNIDHCAILDNFSWGNCNKPDRLAAIVRASYGCLTAARAYGTPFISGKDSLNNEFKTESGESIAIPHTLLISAFGKAVSLDALTTSDLKKAGNKLFIMGLTRQELAGSHFEMVTGQPSVNPPKVDPDAALESFRALNAAQKAGLIESAHDCSEGGIAVSVAEMCIAGRVGSTVNLSAALTDDGCEDSALMFAESNSRIILEIKPENIDALNEAFKGKPLFELGNVGGETLEINGMDGSSLVSTVVDELVTAWREPIYQVFGESAPQG